MESLDNMRKQIDEVQNEIHKKQEILDKLFIDVEVAEGEKFLTLVKDTKWDIDYTYNGRLELLDDKENAVIEKFITSEMKLYPHGRKHITDLLQVSCNDSEIHIIYNPHYATKQKTPKQEFNELIKFAKNYELQLSTFRLDRRLKDAKDVLDKLNTIKDMVNGGI